MGVRRDERITMSEGSFLRMLERPRRIGPDMMEVRRSVDEELGQLIVEREMSIIEKRRDLPIKYSRRFQ